MSLRLFLDEDATFRSLIRALVARGLDVSNAIEAGPAGLSDAEQLEHATGEGRILYSFNIGDYYASTRSGSRQAEAMRGSSWFRSSDTRWASRCAVSSASTSI